MTLLMRMHIFSQLIINNEKYAYLARVFVSANPGTGWLETCWKSFTSWMADTRKIVKWLLHHNPMKNISCVISHSAWLGKHRAIIDHEKLALVSSSIRACINKCGKSLGKGTLLSENLLFFQACLKKFNRSSI